MTITSLRGAGHDARDVSLRDKAAPTHLAVHQLGHSGDALETGGQTQRAALHETGHAAATESATAHDGSASASSLMDTAHSELSGASQMLSDSLKTSSLASSSLSGSTPSKELKVNPDGSITTPGGYTIINKGQYGAWGWSIMDPSGLKTDIWGDPHVDENGDGVDDWLFNTDGTFILGDGTKIFCDTSQYMGGTATVSDTLKIQYGDSLGTMDIDHGGPGVVTSGGIAYDQNNADGDVFVMGTDGKWYDGATGGKLVKTNDDAAVDIDMSRKGHFSNEAMATLHRSQAEAGQLGGTEHTGPLNERLATLVNLENDDREPKLSTDIGVNDLKVKLALQHQQDGTTRLDSHLTRDGNTIQTRDHINPLKTGPQASNFQRELMNAVGTDAAQRALARDRIDDVRHELRARGEQLAEGKRLTEQAGQRLITANSGGARA